MPHINIKHFPRPLTDEQERELVAAVTTAVTKTFDCDEGVVSVALEPVEPGDWQDRVYRPEILGRKSLLRKAPTY